MSQQTTMEPDVIGTTIETTSFEEMMNPYEVDDGSSNKSRRAHYVDPNQNLDFQAEHGPVKNSQELVDNARFHRAEIVALCGYRWVPVLNPKVFPVCNSCVIIAANRIMSDG